MINSRQTSLYPVRTPLRDAWACISARVRYSTATWSKRCRPSRHIICSTQLQPMSEKPGGSSKAPTKASQHCRPQSRPSAIPSPTLEGLAGIFGRNHVPVIVFTCDAESGLNQLTVFRQLEEAAVRTRPGKKTVELCGFDHLCDTSLTRVHSSTRRRKERG